MEQPIVVRYRLTLEEYLQGRHYNARWTCRPLYRLFAHFFVCMMMVVGIFGITDRGHNAPPLIVSLVLILVGVYWFAIRRFHNRWMLRHDFSKHPDKDVEVEWRISSNKLSHGVAPDFELNWEIFRFIVCAPKGVLLYFPTGYFWLPRYSFANDTEYERFIELAKSKFRKLYHVA